MPTNDIGWFSLYSPGLTRPQRERIVLDTGRAVMATRVNPHEVALFLQYATPWVETGETA